MVPGPARGRPPARPQSEAASVHPLRGDEIRALRRLLREEGQTSHVFMTERGGPMTPNAGDWHGLPRLVRDSSWAAVHGQLHGVVPLISTEPHPLDHADDRLAASVDVDVLDGDLLLALATMAI